MMDIDEYKINFFLAFDYSQKRNFELAERHFQQVDNRDIEFYFPAQWYLGKIYQRLGKIEEALNFYNSIPKSDHYSYGIAMLSAFYVSKNIDFLLNLNPANVGSYERAQYELGLFELKKDNPNLLDVYKYWTKFDKNSYMYVVQNYRVGIFKKIFFLENNKSLLMLKLMNRIDDLLQLLKLESEYEELLAHYTNVIVSKSILSKDEKIKSPLRLSSLNFTNDPQEGLLINDLLHFKGVENTKDEAFITCFSLHHDSLNQFRLYGKNDRQEATGLSLVLSKTFFSTVCGLEKIIDRKTDSIKKVDEDSILELPLYRCIYLDPTSGLIKVAQREEWSFHREFKQENKASILESNTEAEKNWQDYQAEILEIESEVTIHLKELVEHVKLLNPQDLNDEEKELLAEILLPLRYLIKHMAFKEEQECRMIYVTQMDNPLIKYDEKINRIYIDYEPSVMEHLEKIYLAPKAKGEKMVFEYLCSRGQAARKGKAPVQVKLSQNPFQ
jgi:protein O-GlcNAc transferase